MPKCRGKARKPCLGKLTTRQRRSQVTAAVRMHCPKQMLCKHAERILVGGDQHLPARGETFGVAGAQGQECFARALPSQPVKGRTWC